MSHVQSMLQNDLISQDEYCQMRDKMKQKYHSVSDGLISESDLQAAENRGLIRRNESTVEVAHEAVKTRVLAGVPLCPDHDSDEKDADGENNLQPWILEDGPENEDEIQAGFWRPDSRI